MNGERKLILSLEVTPRLVAPGPAVNTLLVVRDTLQGDGEETKVNVLSLIPESLQ